MPISASPSARQALEALGLRLREIRKDAELTARALATAAGWHESKCSRIEHGKTAPSESDIRAWSEICGASDQVPDLIATLRAVDGMYIEWKRMVRTGLRRLQEATVPLYEGTRQFRVYEPGVIPGLFQTPGYARALMAGVIAFHQIPDDTDQAVLARMGRQHVLYEGNHRFAVVLEESALRTRIGGAEVMTEQLHRLVGVMALPSVTLGIIPASADRGMWPVEGFWIFDTGRVTVEMAAAEVAITQPREIAIYMRTFAQLADLAVYGNQARELISAAIDLLR